MKSDIKFGPVILLGCYGSIIWSYYEGMVLVLTVSQYIFVLSCGRIAE